MKIMAEESSTTSTTSATGATSATSAIMSRYEQLVKDAERLRGLCQYVQSSELIAQALTIYDEKNPIDSEKGIDLAWETLTRIMLAQGQYAEAVVLCEKVFKIREEKYGVDHDMTLASMDNLAMALLKQHRNEPGAVPNRLNEAKTMCQTVLELTIQKHGEDHADTFLRLDNLSHVLETEGDLAGARVLSERALAGHRRIDGEDDPKTFASMNNLAAVMYKQDEIEGAAQLFRTVLEKRMRLFGDRHESTLGSMNNLGVLLMKSGRIEEAQNLFERALEGRMEVLGFDHPHTRMTVARLEEIRQLRR